VTGANTALPAAKGRELNLRHLDAIWQVRGRVALPPGQSHDEAFERLAPLFQQYGTSAQREGDALHFTKKDQPAQDKMAVFDSGVLLVTPGEAGSELRYQLASRALLFCFFLPFFFIGVAQLTIALYAAEPAKKEAGAKADAKKDEAKKAPPPMHPIDKLLGAPAPDDPKKKKAKKDEEGIGRGKKPKPTPAYVFAGIFAALYLIGRVLEDRLVKRLFTRTLHGA
jgi:hypothetical protein